MIQRLTATSVGLFPHPEGDYMHYADHEAELHKAIEGHAHTLGQVAAVLGVTSQPLDYGQVVEQAMLLRVSHANLVKACQAHRDARYKSDMSGVRADEMIRLALTQAEKVEGL